MNLEVSSALGNAIGSPVPLARPHDDDIALVERADLGCILCTAAAEVEAFSSALSEALGVSVPDAPGHTSRSGSLRSIWLSPRSCLVQCALNEETRLISAATARFPDRTAHAVRYSDQLCWLELTGLGAEPLLKQGGFLSLEAPSLPPGKTKRTVIAGIPVIIVRCDAGWLLGVERSHARYFATWLAAAHARLPQQWRTT